MQIEIFFILHSLPTLPAIQHSKFVSILPWPAISDIYICYKMTEFQIPTILHQEDMSLSTSALCTPLFSKYLGFEMFLLGSYMYKHESKIS